MELKDFDISFVGLKQGVHEFQYDLDKAFFENFGFDEFNSVALTAAVELDKGSTLMDLSLKSTGAVNVNCDVTDEPFDMPLLSSMDLVVKFGEEYNDENEDILILPHGEYKFNVAQYIYEMIVLSLPAKRVHPGVEDGSLQSDVLDRLNDMSVSEPKSNDSETDPRWDVLKSLKKDN
jgi:uncharacterized metal-binding protein YceD (DUF177 family)